MHASRPDCGILAFGALCGALSVMGGAFGAHALKARLAERAFEIFELAMRYQMYHGLALLAVGLLLILPGLELPRRLLRTAGALFILGVFLFCGSLLVYSLGDVRWVVRITPIGGFAWIIAWVLLLISALRLRPASGVSGGNG